MYLDAAAAVNFAFTKGFNASRLVAHGFSLGGVVATAAACQHHLAGLTLDHTFTCPQDVGAHAVADRWMPAWVMATSLCGSWCQDALDRSEHGMHRTSVGSTVRVAHDKTVLTDGLNNLEKVSHYLGPVFVMHGRHDNMMSAEVAKKFLDA